MEVYIWLGVIVLSIIVEASTTALIAIWFAPAALVCAILALAKVNIWVQLGVFVVISVLLMLLFYKKLRDNIDAKSEKTNIDALIGKTGVVEEDISPLVVGRVKIGGMSWSAYCKDGTRDIKKGEYVKVDEVNGVKLLCSPQETPKDESYIFADK